MSGARSAPRVDPFIGMPDNVRSRRALIALLTGTTVALFTLWLAAILRADGFRLIDALLLATFLLQAPWPALAFWNAVIGFMLLNASRDPLARVMPQTIRPGDTAPLAVRTALLLTLRNEDPTGAFARLLIMLRSVDATGHGGKFDVFVLSDSTDAAVIAAEERAFAALRSQQAMPERLHYRRRPDNAGFKGGNLRDFCERWGERYELMVLLDIDSLMSGATLVRLVRIMQANPTFGILQSIGVGLPASSFLARVVQFGHRSVMRVVLMGAAWWQADCGTFWGHNAVVRVRPFNEHCRLPILPGDPPFGGPLISHDQIEAALMRRAGFEVRVLPIECDSYEGNPPALPEFIRRSQRWCQGNLQNLRLLRMPGLAPMSRVQLLYILDQNIGGAAVVLFVTFAAIAAATSAPGAAFRSGSALALLLAWLVIVLAPRILGCADALIRERRRHGGGARLVISGFAECGFALLMLPIWYVATTCALVLLLAGRAATWDVQQRDAYAVTLRGAAAALWPVTAWALALSGLLAIAAPHAIVWFLLFLVGPLLAVPFAVVTARPGLGAWAARHKLCPAPEEIEPPPEITALQTAPQRAA
jgi:membrane glycosyltransferase